MIKNVDMKGTFLSHDLNSWWQTSVLRKEDPYLKIWEFNGCATAGESEYV